MSLTELATRLGYSKAYVSAVETARTPPSESLLEGYERELGLDPGVLADWARAITARSETSEAPPSLLAQASRRLAERAVESTTTRPSVGHAIPPVDSLGRAALGQEGDQPVIAGYSAVMAAAASLVYAAVEQGDSRLGPITMTVSAPPGPLRDALSYALERGWRVSQIFELNRWGGEDRLALVSEMLDLVAVASPSSFVAYSVDVEAAGSLGGLANLLIIPGQGALQFLATQSRLADTALLFDAEVDADQQIIAALTDHIGLLRMNAQPVLQLYEYHLTRPAATDQFSTGALNQLRFDFAVTQAETRPGDRRLLKDGLSLMALPVHVDQARAHRIVNYGDDSFPQWVDALLESRRRRLTAFAEQAASGPYRMRDLCGKRGIERMLAHGTPPRDDWLREPLNPREVASYFRAVIELLNNCAYYELGLVDDVPFDSFWEVAGEEGRETVFIESFRGNDGQEIESDLEINDPLIAAEFRKYFDYLWETLPSSDRDKEKVVSYLETKVNDVLARTGE